MKSLLLILLVSITYNLGAVYTHTIKIDQDIRNTPGKYKFVLARSPESRFTLAIDPDKKLSIASSRNVTVALTKEGLTFTLTPCLTKITLFVKTGAYAGQDIEVTPSVSRYSAFGTSSCNAYTFSLGRDIKKRLIFKELETQRQSKYY
jgi:hypothetical protein